MAHSLTGSIHALMVSWGKKLKSNKPKNPKKLLNGISKKASKLVNRNKNRSGDGKGKPESHGFDGDDGGLWQKSILMGDKCEPLAFSGVIYYDEYGKQVSELPCRSPRVGPMSPLRTFNYQVEK